MREDTISKLKNVIVARRHVNCHSRNFSLDNKKLLLHFLSKLEEEYLNVCVDIDIQKFRYCENEEQEAKILLTLINRELTVNGLNNIHIQAISIAHALQLFGKKLECRALLVFHFFADPYNEHEKNILRSLRKAHRNELSSFLGIIIVSNRKVSRWELYPESNLDERHIYPFDYDQ